MGAIRKLGVQGPVYRHNCKCCVYLGHYEDNDLYYCESPPSVIARFGPGHEYEKGFWLNEDGPHRDLRPNLRVAFLIAKDTGLV